MSQVLFSLSTWLHAIATVVLIGHYLLLTIIYLPALAQEKGGGAMLSAGGTYMPQPAILGQIRQHIAEHPERLSAVLADPDFAATFGTINGERLERPPQGYDETTPGIEFIISNGCIQS